jgi:RNA polymerase sigma-70 factor, ECF subfamily
MSGGYVTLGSEVAHTTSFDFVFAAHHTYVYKLAHALLGNAQDAEDVTQEVFLSVYKSLPTYDPERGSMRTWLTTMAVNVCKRHRRRNFFHYMWKSTWPEDGDDPFEPADLSELGAPEDQALQSEMRKTVKDVLAKLRPEHRTVLVLHYYLDLSCPEIATIVDCPEGTVYSRLHYARRLVRSQLLRQTNGAERRHSSEVGL